MTTSRFFFLSFLVCWGVVLAWCSTPQAVVAPKENTPTAPQVCVTNRCRTVEVADEVKEQQRGLMNRTQMDEDKGMLFVFSQIGSWQFWMKDTLIPLDMIWLDGKGEIVYIASDVPPCTLWDSCPGYWPTEKLARYVLELNAGQAMKYGLQTGALVTLPAN